MLSLRWRMGVVSPGVNAGSGLKQYQVPAEAALRGGFSRRQRRERIETREAEGTGRTGTGFSRRQRRERIETASALPISRRPTVSPGVNAGSGLKQLRVCP